MPAATPAATKPCGGGDGHQGTSPTSGEPEGLGEAEEEVGVLEGLAGGALHEVVLGGDGQDGVGAGVEADGDVHGVPAGGGLGGRRGSSTATNGSPA